ncbi:MAG TPA: class I SAM-dependent methyltransferase, partial [Fimbriiglobus sp.]|nr:class I SAM-dependent methyltransferase [Fimbriiglobus sp.]
MTAAHLGSAYFDTLQAAFSWDVLTVSRDIHPDDGMLLPVPEGPDHYFGVGRSALRAVTAALLAAGAPAPRRILDLPCGYGRVLRALRAAFPDAAVTACDLNRGGVDFCATLGAAPADSADPIDRAGITGPFDLIWCGSLLTHLDRPGWDEFLTFFHRVLAPGGVCVVTTHGA